MAAGAADGAGAGASKADLAGGGLPFGGSRVGEGLQAGWQHRDRGCLGG